MTAAEAPVGNVPRGPAPGPEWVLTDQGLCPNRSGHSPCSARRICRQLMILASRPLAPRLRREDQLAQGSVGSLARSTISPCKQWWLRAFPALKTGERHLETAAEAVLRCEDEGERVDRFGFPARLIVFDPCWPRGPIGSISRSHSVKERETTKHFSRPQSASDCRSQK
jgi:hypothetical protein